MADEDSHSITRMIEDLKGGSTEATRQLWKRYFEKLVRAVDKLYSRNPRHRIEQDSEDAAIIAFHDLFQGVRAGTFAKLDNRDDFWILLLALSVRKARDNVRKQRARKRDPRVPIHNSGDSEEDALEQFIGKREPSAEMTLICAEQYQRIRDALNDDSYRQIFDLRLQGYTIEEIAHTIGCSESTVKRKRELTGDIVKQLGIYDG